MKEYHNHHVRIVSTMLIVLCFTSCGIFDDILEVSLDLGRKRYSGTSYETIERDVSDVGFNCAYLMMMAPPKNPNTTMGLLPANKFRKHQFAYAAAANNNNVLAIEKYRQRPSVGHQTSTGKFIDHFSVMSGLEFVQKNSKYEGTKLKLNYLEVPILAIYNYDLGEDRKVYGGLGPYLAYGLGGKIKGSGFNEKAFDKDLGFKRFDAGLTFTAGYKLNKKWGVRLAYDIGLANIEHESFDKTKNRCISLNVGYSPQLVKKIIRN
jgi:hypothetical protein